MENKNTDLNEIFDELNLKFDEDPNDQSTDPLSKTQKVEMPEEKAQIPEEKPVKKEKPPKRPKKYRLLKSIIWVVVIVLISAGLALGILSVAMDVIGATTSRVTEVQVEIPKGASTEDIANILHDNGLIEHPLIFRVYSKLKKADGTYQYGVYTLDKSMGYAGLISQLQSVGAQAEQVEVTIKEGASIDEISALLEEKGVCSVDDFMTAMKTGRYNYAFIDDIPSESVYYLLEGYLYPETYMFYKGDEIDGVENAQIAINKMLAQLDSLLTDDMYAKAEEMGYSMHEIMTMASMVELESGSSAADMPKVAQVFYNRLADPSFLHLQSDPTSEYVSSRYDTYEIEGLPPGPLCSPSIAAIEAALEPDTSVTAFYFVTDTDMNFYYSDTLQEHEATIADLKSQGKWA